MSLGREGAGDSLRVLVADDNHDAAASLSMVLKALGHEVRTVYDGLSAVDAAKDFKPQIVLLDLGMPVMDGFQAAKRMREEPVLAGAVIVAVTGWGSDEVRQRTKEAGMDEHLVKPADLRR